MDQSALFRMERDDVEFALVATLRTLADLYVPADEEPPEFVPFGYKGFEMIACHLFVLTSTIGAEPRRAAITCAVGSSAGLCRHLFVREFWNARAA